MTEILPDNTMLVLALKSISDGVCISDMNDDILFVNDAFTRMYGYPREELIGKPMNFIRSEKNRPDVVAGILPRTLEGGWTGEVMNRRKDGTEFPVFISTSVIRDDMGQPVALIGTTKDVTEIKRLQDRFRSVADLFRDLGTIQDRNFQIIVRCAREVNGTKISAYIRLDFKSDNLMVVTGCGLPSDWPHTTPGAGRIPFETTRAGGQGWVAFEDLAKTGFAGTDEAITRFGMKSYLGAEVTRQGKIIGTLTVMDDEPRIFGREEIDIIGILARALSLEEDRLHSEHELKIKIAELERFNYLMLGRELRMIELKKEVNELLAMADKPEKYRVTL